MAKKSAEIATLLRVQSWSVDEHRRGLGVLQAREEGLVADRKMMDQELLREQAVASAQPILAGHSYAAFAENYRIRRTQLEALIAALRVEIEAQRERLADAYKELKVLEEVRNEWRKTEDIEKARIEQIGMDEIAQALTRRSNAK